MVVALTGCQPNADAKLVNETDVPISVAFKISTPYMTGTEGSFKDGFFDGGTWQVPAHSSTSLRALPEGCVETPPTIRASREEDPLKGPIRRNKWCVNKQKSSKWNIEYISQFEWCRQAADRLADVPSLQGVISFPTEGDGFGACSKAYRSLALTEGVPSALRSHLRSLAKLADQLQSAVRRGQTAEAIAKSATFDSFFTAGLSFAKEFDAECPALSPPTTVLGGTGSLPDRIGFTPVARGS
jgi:hypothetical protein